MAAEANLLEQAHVVLILKAPQMLGVETRLLAIRFNVTEHMELGRERVQTAVLLGRYQAQPMVGQEETITRSPQPHQLRLAQPWRAATPNNT